MQTHRQPIPSGAAVARSRGQAHADMVVRQ